MLCRTVLFAPLLFAGGGEAGMHLTLSTGGTVYSEYCMKRRLSKQSILPIHAPYVFAREDICGGGTAQNARAKAEYAGTVVDFESVSLACGLSSKPIATRHAAVYEIGNRAEVAAVLSLFDQWILRHRIPGQVFYAFSSAGVTDSDKDATPYLACSFIDGLDPGYIRGNFFEADIAAVAQGEPLVGSNATALNATIVADHNPWVDMFDSWWYQLIFRGFGILFLYAGFCCVKYYRERVRQIKSKRKAVPEVVILVELVSFFALGIHYVLGSWFASPFYPAWLHQGFPSSLLGASMASSLLSGIVFEEVVSNAKKMVVTKKTKGAGDGFYSRNRAKILCYAFFCVFQDMVTFLAGSLVIGPTIVFAGLIVSFSQLAVAISFISKSLKFVRVTSSISASGRQKSAKQAQTEARLRHLAKNLFISAVAMIVATINTIFASILSGVYFHGVYSPGGMCILAFIQAASRGTASWAQIMLSRLPPSSLAQAHRKVSSVPSQGSTTASSMASSATSSRIQSEAGTDLANSDAKSCAQASTTDKMSLSSARFRSSDSSSRRSDNRTSQSQTSVGIESSQSSM